MGFEPTPPKRLEPQSNFLLGTGIVIVILLSLSQEVLKLVTLQPARPTSFRYTYIAPKSDFQFFLTHNYVLNLPLQLQVSHAGFSGSWTLASVGDIRGTNHQIPIIQELESGIADNSFCKIPYTMNLIVEPFSAQLTLKQFPK